MRVLDTETGHFVDVDPKKTPYAILSHTWVRPPKYEQTYQEVRTIQKRYTRERKPSPDSQHGSLSSVKGPQDQSSPTPIPPPSQISSKSSSTIPIAAASILTPTKPSVDRSQTTSLSIWDDPELSPKIRDACRVARENGYQYIWIDSCCIDKTSSSELSEAINSMYLWYARSDVCYAFLARVPAEEDHRAEGSRFRRSKWFRRGWTLQELIAPWDVVFLSQDWTFIGSKHTLHDLVENVTGISHKALLHLEPLDKFGVAQRLSWASRRKTTRVEDRAYSLLGIFDINMPTLYGEGERAFRRLQEEIMRRTPDQSLFAWEDIYLGSEILHGPATTGFVPELQQFDCHPRGSPLLADSLDAFKHGGDIEALSHEEVFARLQLLRAHATLTEYTFTPHGIRTQFPLISFSQYFPTTTTKYPDEVSPSEWHLAILGCEHKDFPGQLLGRVCYIPPSQSGVEFLRPGSVIIDPDSERGRHYSDLFLLSPDSIERCQSQIEPKTVYISHPNRVELTLEGLDFSRRPHKAINLLLTSASRDALHAQGYDTAHLRGPDQEHPSTHLLTLSNEEHAISIEYQHTLQGGGKDFTIKATMQMSRPRLNSASTTGGPSVHQAQAALSPEAQVIWANVPAWFSTLWSQSVTFNSFGAKKHTITLGLDHVGVGYYVPRVEVQVGPKDTTTASSPELVESPHKGGRHVPFWKRKSRGESGERTGEDGPGVVSARGMGRPKEDLVADDERQARIASAKDEAAREEEASEDERASGASAKGFPGEDLIALKFKAPMPNPPTATFSGSPFDNPAADVVIRSRDGVHFRVRSAILTEASPIFSDMLASTRSKDTADEKHVLTVPEESGVIDPLLRLCYPVTDPIFADVKDVRLVLAAANKYQMAEAIVILKKQLSSYMNDQPLRVWASACLLRLADEARAAACALFGKEFPVKAPPEFEEVSSGDYFRLTKFLRAGANVPESFTFWDPAPEDVPAAKDQRRHSLSLSVEASPPVISFQPRPYADIVCRSSDGVDLRAHRIILSLASSVLERKISRLCPDPPPTPASLPVLELDAPIAALGPVLEACYPTRRRHTVPLDLRELMPMMDCARKYDLQQALEWLSRGAFWLASRERPLASYLMAARMGFADYARSTLTNLSGELHAYGCPPEMEDTPATFYHRLLINRHQSAVATSRLTGTATPTTRTPTSAPSTAGPSTPEPSSSNKPKIKTPTAKLKVPEAPDPRDPWLLGLWSHTAQGLQGCRSNELWKFEPNLSKLLKESLAKKIWCSKCEMNLGLMSGLHDMYQSVRAAKFNHDYSRKALAG